MLKTKLLLSHSRDLRTLTRMQRSGTRLGRFMLQHLSINIASGSMLLQIVHMYVDYFEPIGEHDDDG